MYCSNARSAIRVGSPSVETGGVPGRVAAAARAPSEQPVPAYAKQWYHHRPLISQRMLLACLRSFIMAWSRSNTRVALNVWAGYDGRSVIRYATER